LADQDIASIPDYDGGTSSGGGSDFSGGSSFYPSSPIQGASGGTFTTRYKNVALTRDQFALINATFRDFNDPSELRFIGDSLRVTKKADTLDFLNLAEFFHPLQDFSDYQKQTFVISPRTTVNLDPAGFPNTNGEVSMIIARDYYLPESDKDQRIIFWEYEGSGRNPMGQFMVLTGAVKNGYSWQGWDLNPFSTVDNSDPANISMGGIFFTNPGDMDVKITIITAN